ncbi:family 16 glycoside hydrolase [Fodinibius sediminis]|nr:family 16 glycoside hydrolase [Fodinibius sediminis]
MKRTWFAYFIILLLMVQACGGSHTPQEKVMERLPMKQLSLQNLDSFRETSQNWTLAGQVVADRNKIRDLQGVERTGILVNIPTERHQDHLLTRWMHGDLELEMDFLMPGNSSSGIFLMGRYEIQLHDSWNVKAPQFSDLGGIYQRWDDSKPEGNRGFDGKAPTLNAARAPGLWQHVKIKFSAPEFDQEGDKIANAKFEEVWINGVLVQEDAEISGPTRAAAFEEEAARGPLMIQGDHGPVAIRNVRYKRYDKKSIQLANLDYDYYAGTYDRIPDFDSLQVTESGSTDSLAGNIIDKDDRYALKYTGTLRTPNRGKYLFRLQNAGMVRMKIDDKIIFDQNSYHRMHENHVATVMLDSGRHTFSLEYLDHQNDWYWGLTLFAEGPHLRYQRLHSLSSVPGGGRSLPDIVVESRERVKVLRSFTRHGNTKRTHVVNVGFPNQVNFNYDMGQGALLQAWNGPFINTNEMWVNRGEAQVAKPAGPSLSFDGKPSFATLAGGSSSWPDSVSWDVLQVEGYSISQKGIPVFSYNLDGISIEDRIEGQTHNRRLVRTIRFSADDPRDDFWMHLASGETIEEERQGEYIVGDRSFYLDIEKSAGAEPRIIETEAGQELRLKLLDAASAATITYAVIW